MSLWIDIKLQDDCHHSADGHVDVDDFTERLGGDSFKDQLAEVGAHRHAHDGVEPADPYSVGEEPVLRPEERHRHVADEEVDLRHG